MSGDFRIIDDISVADIAFEVKGKNIHELFEASSFALLSIMLENPESVTGDIEKEFTIEADSIEMLLYDFLNEIITIKDADRMLLLPYYVHVSENSSCIAVCKAKCRTIDHAVHEFNVDVKAITMHGLTIEKLNEGWRAVVVVDI